MLAVVRDATCTDGEVVCDERGRPKRVSAAFNRSVSTSPREWQLVIIDFLFGVGSGIPLDSPRISLDQVGQADEGIDVGKKQEQMASRPQTKSTGTSQQRLFCAPKI